MVDARKFPEGFDIYITSTCHAKCKFCYAKRELEPGESISFENFRKIIDGIASAGLPSGCEVSLGGGEPFMHPQIREMLKYAVEKLPGRPLYVGTNLFWLSRNPARAREQMKEIPREINFGISYDPEHARHVAGLDERVKNLIAVLKERGAKWTMTSTVSGLQYFGLSKMLNALGAKMEATPELGKTFVEIGGSSGEFVVRSGGGYKRSIKGAKRNMGRRLDTTIRSIETGFLPRDVIGIMPNGLVTETHHLTGFLQLPELALGNWKTEGMGAIIRELPQRRQLILQKLKTERELLLPKMLASAKILKKKFNRKTWGISGMKRR